MRRVIVYTIFLGLFSCQQTSEEEKLLSQFSQSLQSNNEQLNSSISHIRSVIKSRARQPQGIPCMTKMDSLGTLVSSILDSVIHFVEKGQIDNSVTDRVNLSLKQLEDVDTELKKEFKKSIDSVWTQFKDDEADNKGKYSTVKKMMLVNLILQIKNTMLFYLNSRCTDCGVLYEAISTLISQNSTNLHQGDELKITAGVGAFSYFIKPSFKINDKWHYPEKYYPFEYEMKVQQKPGKYKMPVEIKFVDFNGIEQIQTRIIEYEVVQ